MTISDCENIVQGQKRWATPQNYLTIDSNSNHNGNGS